jgi:non-ribosomal peptide synthetase component F
MIEDAAARVIITQQHLADTLPSHSAEMIYIDRQWQQIAARPGYGIKSEVRSDNVAYVIYTSGSTGRPKGVAIEHRNTAALLGWAEQTYSLKEMRGVLAATSMCFDLSVFEMFGPLSRGGSCIVVENALKLGEVAEDVTLVNTVPSAMAELVRMGAIASSVETINLAGEALGAALVDELYEASKVERVYDLYGPTEDTTYST